MISKDFSSNIVNESGNVPRLGVVPRFSDLAVIALSMTSEHFSIDLQLDLFRTANIKLEVPYRLNQKDWKPQFIPFAKARKRIETVSLGVFGHVFTPSSEMIDKALNKDKEQKKEQ